MCGRFSLSTHIDELADRFEASIETPPSARYNIAPTQRVAAVRASAADGRTIVALRWGLVPSWAGDVSIGSRLINARAETVAEKPAFRTAFRHRRCLIPADGFYEWKRTGRKREKQPYHIRRKDGGLFAFAGLWEVWKGGKSGAADAPVESAAVITTAANDVVRPLHDRMPVIVPAELYALWLDPGVTEPTRVASVLRPYPAELMTAGAVSTTVNSPRHDGPECITPATSGDLFGPPDLFGPLDG